MRNGAVEMVQGMWGPEGVSALVIMVVVIVAREWRRVQLARERRRGRAQERLAERVSGVAGGEREARGHQGGAAGVSAMTGAVAGCAGGGGVTVRCGCATVVRPASGR